MDPMDPAQTTRLSLFERRWIHSSGEHALQSPGSASSLGGTFFFLGGVFLRCFFFFFFFFLKTFFFLPQDLGCSFFGYLMRNVCFPTKNEEEAKNKSDFFFLKLGNVRYHRDMRVSVDWHVSRQLVSEVIGTIACRATSNGISFQLKARWKGREKRKRIERH